VYDILETGNRASENSHRSLGAPDFALGDEVGQPK